MTTIPRISPGRRLAMARKEAGFTQQRMAREMQVSPGAIAQWETDRVQPRQLRQRMHRWAELTNVPYEWLMTGSYAAGESNPEPTDYGLVAA